LPSIRIVPHQLHIRNDIDEKGLGTIRERNGGITATLPFLRLGKARKQSEKHKNKAKQLE
jgi:hypothetical protein